mmetsp:Transcript_9085/g.12359  ORF Transcript_9085/g.12359 Transcript_9085/m.12359 type:complete len:81 (+) Transcript_9085:1404-1646(+)
MCYGYQEIATILNLQDARLLKLRDKRFDWNKIKSELGLVLDEDQPQPPVDRNIHYVFSFMAPISVSLINHMFVNRGFTPI